MRIGSKHPVKERCTIFLGSADPSFYAVVFFQEPALLHQRPPYGMARRIAKGVGELFPFNGFKEWTGSFPAFQTQEIDQQPLAAREGLR